MPKTVDDDAEGIAGELPIGQHKIAQRGMETIEAHAARLNVPSHDQPPAGRIELSDDRPVASDASTQSGHSQSGQYPSRAGGHGSDMTPRSAESPRKARAP